MGVEIHWGFTFTGLQPPPKKGKYFCALGNPYPPKRDPYNMIREVWAGVS